MSLNAAALIIGINKYSASGIPVLSGCVSDALGAAKWLVSIGVPSERIIVHAVSHEKLPTFPAGIHLKKSADLLSLRASMRKLSKYSGDHLYIFISGHGMHVLGTGPIFLCQNYLVDDDKMPNLHINDYINWFRSFPYRNQFLFYDACQDWTAASGHISQVHAQGTGEDPGSYKPSKHNAFTALYACGAGETAWAGDNRGGVLIHHTLDALEPQKWVTLNPDGPRQEAIVYDWQMGTRSVNLQPLFQNLIYPNIIAAVTAAGKRGPQTPYYDRLGRTEDKDQSLVMNLPLQPTAEVKVVAEPPGVIPDLQSVSLRTSSIARPLFLPSATGSLRVPINIRSPRGASLRAGCELSPGSAWFPVNVPLEKPVSQSSLDFVLEFSLRPPAPSPKNAGTGGIDIVVSGDRPGPTGDFSDVAKDGAIGDPPTGVSLEYFPDGAKIAFDPKVRGSDFKAERFGQQWLRALRKSELTKGSQILLSPPGQSRSLAPNLCFDLPADGAKGIAGYLADADTVTIDSLSDRFPPRTSSLREIENHPFDWVEPGLCRITIELPWGRWTSLLRVKNSVQRVRLPASVGEQPLRNSYREDGPGPIRIEDAPAYEPGIAVINLALNRAPVPEAWGFPLLPLPILVEPEGPYFRIEPFSETILPGWDRLLTCGRLDGPLDLGPLEQSDPQTAFGGEAQRRLFALALAYQAYARADWKSLEKVLVVFDDPGFQSLDQEMLRLALQLQQGDLNGTELHDAIHAVLDKSANLALLPLLRWGATLMGQLALTVERDVPSWVPSVDPANALTVISREGLASLGVPLREHISNEYWREPSDEFWDDFESEGEVFSPTVSIDVEYHRRQVDAENKPEALREQRMFEE